jgi:SAM-dependent methyltransferase
LLAKRGQRVVGVDYSAPSLRRAADYDPAGICHYAATDGYALPFPDGTFDLVVCIGVLQAVARPTAVVDEAARVLRRGGVLVTEALNARAVAARLGRVRARVRRLPPRVRQYDPGTVARWLGERGLTLVARMPIVLPPRGMPRLVALLDAPRVKTLLEADVPFIEALAHSFLFVARRDGEST